MAKKWQNLGFAAKFLTKFALFDKWKDKWEQKASKLFWQDLIELANNSYSYALLKQVLFSDSKIWGFLAKFLTKFALFDERKMTFLAAKSFGVYKFSLWFMNLNEILRP